VEFRALKLENMIPQNLHFRRWSVLQGEKLGFLNHLGIVLFGLGTNE